MKVHPLFGALLRDLTFRWATSAGSYGEWEKAGKPVVEEAEPVSDEDPPAELQAEIDVLREAVERHRVEKLKAWHEADVKDARIKELEAQVERAIVQDAAAWDANNRAAREIDDLRRKLAEGVALVAETQARWNTCREKLAEAEKRAAKTLDDQRMYGFRLAEYEENRVRNDALEEAAKEAEQARVDFNEPWIALSSGSPEIAARIRGLKK